MVLKSGNCILVYKPTAMDLEQGLDPNLLLGGIVIIHLHQTGNASVAHLCSHYYKAVCSQKCSFLSWLLHKSESALSRKGPLRVIQDKPSHSRQGHLQLDHAAQRSRGKPNSS